MSAASSVATSETGRQRRNLVSSMKKKSTEMKQHQKTITVCSHLNRDRTATDRAEVSIHQTAFFRLAACSLRERLRNHLASSRRILTLTSWWSISTTTNTKHPRHPCLALTCKTLNQPKQALGCRPQALQTYASELLRLATRLTSRTSLTFHSYIKSQISLVLEHCLSPSSCRLFHKQHQRTQTAFSAQQMTSSVRLFR